MVGVGWGTGGMYVCLTVARTRAFVCVLVCVCVFVCVWCCVCLCVCVGGGAPAFERACMCCMMRLCV